jgi:hypothetical protein
MGKKGELAAHLEHVSWLSDVWCNTGVAATADCVPYTDIPLHST